MRREYLFSGNTLREWMIAGKVTLFRKQKNKIFSAKTKPQWEEQQQQQQVKGARLLGMSPPPPPPPRPLPPPLTAQNVRLLDGPRRPPPLAGQSVGLLSEQNVRIHCRSRPPLQRTTTTITTMTTTTTGVLMTWEFSGSPFHLRERREGHMLLMTDT